MFSIIKNKDNSNYGHIEYVLDTPEDLQQIPKVGAPGSLCFIISDSSIYMLNHNQEWKKIG